MGLIKTVRGSLTSLKIVPIYYLRECFLYDEFSGDFYHLLRPEEHFESKKHQSRFNGKHAGKKAGGFRSGYVILSIVYKQIQYSISAHHLALVFSNIEIPDGFVVDHINGNPSDNRLCNLRVCTYSQNNRNMIDSHRSSSGYKGVYKSRAGNYRVTIHIGLKSTQIGTYSTLEEAVNVRKEAEKEYYGEFARQSE